MFTYLTCQVYHQHGEKMLFPTWAPIFWTGLLSEHFRGNRKREAYAVVSAVGWPHCFSLSEADLIVKMGDGGVQAQGSVGQPYFLTLDSRARGDGGQRVKLNLIPGFPLPAVMYIHWSSRCLALLEIHKKVNC